MGEAQRQDLKLNFKIYKRDCRGKTPEMNFWILPLSQAKEAKLNKWRCPK